MDQEVILSGVSEVCLINMYELIKKPWKKQSK